MIPLSKNDILEEKDSYFISSLDVLSGTGRCYNSCIKWRDLKNVTVYRFETVAWKFVKSKKRNEGDI